MSESWIIDLSELGTKAAERRFMLPFLETLYRKHGGDPLHVVFDEADMWAPERLLDKEGDAAKLLGMMETLVRRGRVKGFIPWLISQRPAVLSKNVLSQVDGLIAMKLTSSQDRKALGAWIEGQADQEQGKKILGELPTKQRGEAVIWIPARDILKEAAFPERETFDSSRTPKRGEKAKKTVPLAPVDLDKLKEKLSTVEAEAKANDPRALRAEIAKLKSEKATLERKAPAETANAQRSRDDAKAVAVLRRALEVAMKFIVEINAADFFKAGGDAIDKKKLEKVIADATAQATKMIEGQLEQRNRQVDRIKSESERIIKTLAAALEQDVTVKVNVRHNEEFTIAPNTARPRLAPAPFGGNGTYAGPQMKVLRSLAMWRGIGHEQPSKEMVAAVAGYSPTSGGYANLLGTLRTMGAVDYPTPGRISLATDGIDVISRDEGRDILLSVLKNPQRKIVDAVMGNEVHTKEAVAEATGYSPTSGGFANLLGSLRTIGIIDYPQPGHVALSDWAAELLQ